MPSFIDLKRQALQGFTTHRGALLVLPSDGPGPGLVELLEATNTSRKIMKSGCEAIFNSYRLRKHRNTGRNACFERQARHLMRFSFGVMPAESWPAESPYLDISFKTVSLRSGDPQIVEPTGIYVTWQVHNVLPHVPEASLLPEVAAAKIQSKGSSTTAHYPDPCHIFGHPHSCRKASEPTLPTWDMRHFTSAYDRRPSRALQGFSSLRRG